MSYPFFGLMIRLIITLFSYSILIFLFYFSRSAYRAEVATFVVPVAGESASDTRLRERIDITSNILFFIEDLYLALGPGHVTTKTGAKINVASSLLWVRSQLAGSVKELMIAKKSGWQVLRNLKNEQLTGEHKQMAKAMAKANKAASKTPVFKKRSASSSNAPPPKRRSYSQQQDLSLIHI